MHDALWGDGVGGGRRGHLAVVLSQVERVVNISVPWFQVDSESSCNSQKGVGQEI